MGGDIPVLVVEADSIPEAWENAVIDVWEKGIDIKTEYDKHEGPPSKDATVMVIVKDPFKEPRIHRNIPGGPVELESYNQEVVQGIHDHWINPEKGKWSYTYHERLFTYSPTDNLNRSEPLHMRPFTQINQVNYIIEKLAQAPYSRRAQAITWMPTLDPKTDEPPCLQRIWARISKDESNNELVLNLNSHWRSRDLYKAGFMNVYALTNLQKIIARQISDEIGKYVRVGKYVDISDSLHIYGSYFDEAEREVKKMKTEPIEKRVWKSDHPAFSSMTEDTRKRLAGDPDCFARGDQKKQQ